MGKQVAEMEGNHLTHNKNTKNTINKQNKNPDDQNGPVRHKNWIHSGGFLKRNARRRTKKKVPTLINAEMEHAPHHLAGEK